MYKLSPRTWLVMKITYWTIVMDIVIPMFLATYAQQTGNDKLLDFVYYSNVFTGIFFILYFGMYNMYCSGHGQMKTLNH